MRNVLKITIPAAIVAFGLFLNSSVSYAKPAYAKKEKKACVYCHVKAGSKELNVAGEYYKSHNHSLDGYKPTA